MEDIEDWALEDLLGTVSAVSLRRESLLRAPASVTVFSRQDIRLSGARTIPDLLRRVPGIQIYQTAPGNFVVSMRGTSGLQGNNVIVRLDGAPLNSRLDGSINWAGLPAALEEVEQIEVVRGPVSTIYGANAYTGVIDITTVKLTRSFVWTAGLAAGGDDQRALTGELRATARGALADFFWKVGVHAGQDQTNGAGGVGSPELTPATELGANLHGEQAIGETLLLRMQIAGSVNRRSPLSHLVVTPVRDQERLLLGSVELVHEGQDSALDGFRVSLLGSRLDMQRADDRPDFDRSFSLGGSRALYGQLRAELGFRFGAVLLQVGGSAALEQVSAPFLHPAVSGAWRPEYGAFAIGDLRVGEAWTFSAGVRGDASPLAGLRGSARLSANYLFDSALSTRLVFATGFRRPTYVEAAGLFLDPDLGIVLLEGSRDVHPQTNDSIELGLIWAPSRAFRISPTIYASRLHDVISEDFESLVRKSFRNQRHGGLIDVFGLELEASYVIDDAWTPRLALGTLTWLEDGDSEGATLGVPASNSKVTASLGSRGEFLDARLGYGVSVEFASARSYDVRVGIPPLSISERIPNRFLLMGALDSRLFDIPLWAWIRAQAPLPGRGREAPFPRAGDMAARVMVGLEYRDW